METLAFAFGIVSAVLLLTVGGIVWAIRQINQTKHELNSIYYQMDEVNRNTNFRIDREIEDTHQTFRDVEVDIRSQLDSRLDKLSNQIVKQIPPTNDEVLRELKQVKEDFLSLRQNL
jgi:uncharacterized FlaG/YvyC family protein